MPKEFFEHSWIDPNTNFKNDPLILDDISERKTFTTVNNLINNSRDIIFLDNNILNLYSCFVKANDFYSKNKIFNRIPYVGGSKLSIEIKSILENLSPDLKTRNFLGLRKLIWKYCGVEKPEFQRVWFMGKLIKKCFKQGTFPFHFLRIITLDNQKQFYRLLEKIEFITSFCGSTRIYIPNRLDKIKNQRLCYLAGVILGDGYLLSTKKDYRISISDGSPHTTEVKESFIYMKNLTKLISTIFNISKEKIVITKYGNYYDLHISSKWLTRFFNFFFGIPYGKKKGKIRTPKILDLFDSKKYQKIFWRGVFDTDGMIHPHARNVEIASSDYLFMADCKEFLSKLTIYTMIKHGTDGKKGNLYYWMCINSNDFKKFGEEIGSSHPRKQKMLVKHLKNNLNYYILKDVNRELIKDGKFRLDILKHTDKRFKLPKEPTEKLLELAVYINPMDWEKKRIFFRMKHTDKKEVSNEILSKFKDIFKLEPKFLESRNVYYVNSQTLCEFFRKFFVYDQPWQPISNNKSERFIQQWNDVFKVN